MSATSPSGTIFHAPVQGPRTVLDIGCGTGVVSRALAALFPGAAVRGIDMVAMPEQHAAPPRNLEFVQGDCHELIRGLGGGFADYAFSRLLVCGMTDWPAHVRVLADGLASGGWLELQEWDFVITEDGSDVTSQWEWQAEMIRLAGERIGLDLRCAQKLGRWMEEAGLVDIRIARYKAPIGKWDVGARPQTENMAQYLERWWEPACKVLLGKVVEDEKHRSELEGKLERDLEAARTGRRISYEIVVCCGRKP